MSSAFRTFTNSTSNLYGKIAKTRSNQAKTLNYLCRISKYRNVPSQFVKFIKFCPENQKQKYASQLFQKMNAIPIGQEMTIKQNILETLYRIIQKTKQEGLLGQIKSQFTCEILKENDYTSLLKIGVSLSAQYVNILCELGSKCTYVYERIRKIYPKTMLRKILYEQHKYSQRTVVLKLFYYFYINGNDSIYNHEIQDIIENLVFPQIKHLPSVCQYLALQNLELKQNQTLQKSDKNQRAQRGQKQNRKDLIQNVNQEEIASLKRKFEDLILYEQTTIEPSQQQKYWTFIYNSQDEGQMSLINFTILLFKIQSKQNTEKFHIEKKTTKSLVFQSFIKYLNDLCQFLKGAFNKNSNQYQRKIVNKLEQILIIYEQRNQFNKKTLYVNISQSDKEFIRHFFNEFSNVIIKQNISYHQIVECASVRKSDLNKRRAGQNLEKMVLEEDFILFIQKVGKNVQKVKQFHQSLNEKKITQFFNLYRCNKVRKINLFKFLQKLFEFLESRKDFQIKTSNEKFQNLQRQSIFNELKQGRNQSFDFRDSIDQNNIIELHFQNFIQRYEPMLKMTLLNKWIGKNGQYLNTLFQKYKGGVFQKMKGGENGTIEKNTMQGRLQKATFSQKKIKNSLALNPIVGAKKVNHQDQQVTHKQSIWFYLQKWCSGNRTCQGNLDAIYSFGQNLYANNILQIHSRYYKVSLSFSRIVLWILAEINKCQQLSIRTNELKFSQYMDQIVQHSKSASSNTQNKIIQNLILNLSRNSKHIQGTNHQNRPFSSYSQCNNLSNSRNHNVKTAAYTNTGPDQNITLIRMFFKFGLKNLDNQIKKVINFNLHDSISWRFSQNKYYQAFFPYILKTKVQILQYGLRNRLFQIENVSKIQDHFTKFIEIWAYQEQSFSDPHWLQILTLIIGLFNKHFSNIKNFAHKLSNNTAYVQRFNLLVTHCSIIGLKTTNISDLVQIKLLKLLLEFNMKFYLQNNKEAVGQLFNGIDFACVVQSVQNCYKESIEPKLASYQNQTWCQDSSADRNLIIDTTNLNKCSFQLCNQNKITENDKTIMQIFVNLLILVQISISLHRSNHFIKPLSKGSLSILNTFQSFLNLSSNQISKQAQIVQANYLHFYRRFIGIIYFLSQEKSLVKLHFKIPYLQKYCTKTVKEELLYYLRGLDKGNIEKHLEDFSMYLQAELEDRKSYHKMVALSFVVNYKQAIQKFIILIAFIHAASILIPSWVITETFFKPFTTLFIIFKLLFAFMSYRKVQNVTKYILQDKTVGLKQRFSILFNEKFFFSLFLVLLYLASYLVPQIFGVIALVELYNLRFCQRISTMIMKALVNNIFWFFLAFVSITVFFGILESQNNQKGIPIDTILLAFMQFYTFTVSNLKITRENSYTVSKKYPVSFILYQALIILLIFRTLYFFLKELKVQNDEKNNLDKCCVICLRKNIDFQKQGSSFKKHTKLEHNLWHYLFFFIYIRRKVKGVQKNSITSIERYIKQSIQKKKYDFIKLNRAH